MKTIEWFNVLFVLIGIIFILILLLMFWPILTTTLISHSHPNINFEESLTKIQLLMDRDSVDVDPEARTIVFHHGKKMNRVIVFFHGFTNSPRQFKVLGERFFKAGYNVVIPRIPYHGLTKDAAHRLSQLKAEDLVRVIDESVDIANGLGEDVTVAGLSMGGVMSGWAALNREDIQQAVLIAPNFGTYQWPNIFLKPSTHILSWFGNIIVWWDTQLKEELKVPAAVYRGFPARSLSEIRRLGWYVQSLSNKRKPSVEKILVITNANDQAVSAQAIEVVVKNWQRYPEIKLLHYQFPLRLKLGHDLIDPQQPNQNIEVVYPQIFSLMTQDFSFLKERFHEK